MNLAGASDRVKLVRWLRSLALTVCMLLTWPAAAAIPDFAEVQKEYLPSDALLLDRNGEVIHRLRINQQVRRLDWVKLGNISPTLVAALIQAEDKRFYAHAGVDWAALAE
ncbi:MAG TPA: transglycosylase domain-containing protein, partial [Gallionella sp.]|nr:transglycosylase domain-containing protein [Gallionella sp.]